MRRAAPSIFPRAIRLIAALSLATLVVEAAPASGALITARLAADAGREVCALPGSIHNELARGCHQLIREGAALVETAEEVMALARRRSAKLRESLRARRVASLPTVRATAPGKARAARAAVPAILRAMSHDPVNLDQLCLRTGLTVAPLSAMLVRWSWKGKSPPNMAVTPDAADTRPRARARPGERTMKETILDVLLFLFENYFYDDPDAVRDRDSLQHGLIQAGFSPAEISKAFDWLEELANQRPVAEDSRADGPVRVYVEAGEATASTATAWAS
jgi:DNA processing protein